MEKNTIIAIVLSSLVIIGSLIFQTKVMVPKQQAAAKQQRIEQAKKEAEAEVQQIVGSGFVVRQQLIVQFLRLFVFAVAGERPGQHTVHVRIVFRLVVQTEQQPFCLIIPFQIGQTDSLVQQI